jgi:hypothetical protein
MKFRSLCGRVAGRCIDENLKTGSGLRDGSGNRELAIMKEDDIFWVIEKE